MKDYWTRSLHPKQNPWLVLIIPVCEVPVWHTQKPVSQFLSTCLLSLQNKTVIPVPLSSPHTHTHTHTHSKVCWLLSNSITNRTGLCQDVKITISQGYCPLTMFSLEAAGISLRCGFIVSSGTPQTFCEWDNDRHKVDFKIIVTI